MNAVLLCAGFATRMYPLTRDFPKPLLPVGGRPVLDYLLDDIAALPGIDSILLVSNERFHAHFRDWRERHLERGSYPSLRIVIVNDGCRDNEHRLGAAGDLALALRRIGAPGRVAVFGGDNIYRFSLEPVWNAFLAGRRHRILALVEHDDEQLRRTGVIEFGAGDRVVRLHEKPARPPSSWSCPPLYFFQPSVWDELDRFLAAAGDHDAPGHFIDFLCRHGVVEASRIDGVRLDIGSLESYRRADLLLAGGG